MISSAFFLKHIRNFTICRSLSTGSSIGFIGLGNMGGFMALNLSKARNKVVVFDTDPERIKRVKDLGPGDNFEEVKSIADIVKGNGVKTVVTMLPSTPQVESVYLSESGLLNSAERGTLFIDCTTGDPAASQNVAKKAEEKKCLYIDCPVSGGVNAARDAGLTFMVGGSDEAVKLAKPVLDVMGKKTFHCGPVGTGLAAKICNNLLLAISMIGVSESMNLGIKLGLKPAVLAQVLNSATGRCWSSDTYNPVPGVMEGVPASRDYEGGFGTALMLKDLGLAQKASLDQNASIPLGGLALQIYRLLTQHGMGMKDFGVVYKYLSESTK